MPTPPAHSLDDLRRVVERHWGFHSFRPLQEGAIRAVLDGRDSLVVLPTGGGKSLCYQAPAVLRGDTTVVVSPLIALMKDQVDNLQAAGVPAIQLDSSQTPEERWGYEQDVRRGAIRLLFVSPERLVNTNLYQLLRQIDVRTFAIDEAHCISHWGHDFRPEYRQLSRLRKEFPRASVHAYTATANEQVRRDIIAQLALRDPEVLVGNFDRPNLTYRVLPRHDRTKQVLEVLDRHPGEAGIIYCSFQRDVEELTDVLRGRGYDARRYHAGLSGEERRTSQEAFISEECNLIVATVAFGMGIDRPNIRFVLHTGMPKSLEHYQQETGRAGRDGLAAECILLHSGADLMTWRSILEKNVEEAGADPSFLPNVLRHLDEIDRFCRGVLCRHRALVEHFGQTYPDQSCEACDLCLGDTEPLANALVLAQKILSCVARVRERFGIGHVIKVLRGKDDERLRKFGHDVLTTFGALKDQKEVDIRDWIYQLLSQQVLVQNEVTLGSGDKVGILGLNAASWEVMRGQREVKLLKLVRRRKGEKAQQSRADTTSWEGVDRGLFEELRKLRRRLAEQRGVKPWIIFGDASLRELARVRPSTLEALAQMYGVGATRLRDHGETFLETIVAYCREHLLSRDERSGVTRREAPRPVPAAPRAEAAPAPAKPRPAPPERAATPLPKSLEVAQKILSCVAKVKESFPASHVVRVLRGRDTEKVRTHGHEQLSTYGLLREHSAAQVVDWIVQLAEQGFLAAGEDADPVLRLNVTSWAVMRGQVEVRLLPLAGSKETQADDPELWERVDRELFDALDELRQRLAEEQQVEPRATLSDYLLREVARVRPSSLERMRLISGLGDGKLNTYGRPVLDCILEHCRARGLATDQPPGKAKSAGPLRRTAAKPEEQEAAFTLYDGGATVEQVVQQTGWSADKAVDYLCDFVREAQPASIDTWVAVEVQQRVASAARMVGTERLKPIYLALGEKVSYDEIRIVLTQLLATHSGAESHTRSG